MKVTRNDRQAKVRICPDCESREVDKYCTYCSECAHIRNEFNILEYQSENKIRIANMQKISNEKRKKEIAIYQKQYKIDNAISIKKNNETYRKENRKILTERTKKYKKKKLNEETV